MLLNFLHQELLNKEAISLECGLAEWHISSICWNTNYLVKVDLLTYMVPTAANAFIMMVTSLFFVFIVKKNT